MNCACVYVCLCVCASAPSRWLKTNLQKTGLTVMKVLLKCEGWEVTKVRHTRSEVHEVWVRTKRHRLWPCIELSAYGGECVSSCQSGKNTSICVRWWMGGRHVNIQDSMRDVINVSGWLFDSVTHSTLLLHLKIAQVIFSLEGTLLWVNFNSIIM